MLKSDFLDKYKHNESLCLDILQVLQQITDFIEINVRTQCVVEKIKIKNNSAGRNHAKLYRCGPVLL